MVSIQQPLRQLRQPLRQRPSKKMTLSATDEFWLAPLEDSASSDATSTSTAPASSAAPALSVASAATGGDDGDFMEVIVLPAAHQQLLSSDPVIIEDLKGYDHRRDVMGRDNDGYASDKSSCAPKQGRGSWLLGLSDSLVPGLVRMPSGVSLESDECSTSSESDDDSSLASSSGKRPRGGVSFDTVVKVQPIPHSDTLTVAQRRKMYNTSWEVRQNKIRNKKEFRYDGYDWRNATEEWEMGVDMVTGELIHPVHEYAK